MWSLIMISDCLIFAAVISIAKQFVTVLIDFSSNHILKKKDLQFARHNLIFKLEFRYLKMY